MDIYPQTQCILASFIFLAVALLARKNLDANKRTAIIVALFITMAPSIYSINCLMSGKCEIWAWYNSIILSIWCVSVALLSLSPIKN
jgi:hypothetical protein